MANTDPQDSRLSGGPLPPTVISIDAMGGDLGASAVVAGMAKSAAKNAALRFVVHGDGDQLARLIGKRRGLAARCEIVHADRVVTMDARPGHVMRHGQDTSMYAAIDSVRAGDASVAISCGNTGALMALSMVRLRKIAGVGRPAIACLWPARQPHGVNIMLDVGADIRADPHDLMQYALMGVSYCRNGFGVARPRVGLLNVGTEDNKGRAELKTAAGLIEAMSSVADFAYAGFVEGGDIPSGEVDVIVTDGFTGNVALKTGEGTARMIRELLKEAFAYSPLSRLASVMAYTSLRRLGKRIDPRRSNGGVFLGLNGTVVKSHGAADATGVSAAIKLAAQLAASDLHGKIGRRIAEAQSRLGDGDRDLTDERHGGTRSDISTHEPAPERDEAHRHDHGKDPGHDPGSAA